MDRDRSLSGSLDEDNGWYQRVPLELHGHRKKLDFFLSALERFRTERRQERGCVSVLEIGCSNGQNVSFPLAERGFDVTGVDLHEPSIAWANAHNKFSNARFICRNASSFESERLFDVIVLSDILEHVTAPLELLLLANRLLRDGGMVLICIPNGFGPAEIERRLIEITGVDRVLRAIRRGVNKLRHKQESAYNEDSGHIQYFRMRTIKDLIGKSGFALEDCKKGALFGGGVTYPLGRLFPGLVKVSLRCADRLPFWSVSTWYFRLSKTMSLPQRSPQLSAQASEQGCTNVHAASGLNR